MAEAEHAVQTHLAVGNINLDVTLSIPRLPGPDENVRARDFWLGLGGAATNYAIAVARLGHKPVLVARAGREAVALGLLDSLKREGVDISLVRLVDEPIGVVVVLLVREMGTRSMVTMRGANELLDASLIPRGRWDVVHFASVKPSLIEEADYGHARLVTYDPGGEVFVDPEGVRRAAGMVDVVMVNARELEAVAGGDSVEHVLGLMQGRLRYLIVKKGRGGAVLFSKDGKVHNIDSFHVDRPVDVTGAGDAFDAAFNVWLLETGDPATALRAAVAAGSVKTLKRGSSSMPYRGEVEEVIGG